MKGNQDENFARGNGAVLAGVGEEGVFSGSLSLGLMVNEDFRRVLPIAWLKRMAGDERPFGHLEGKFRQIIPQ